MIEISLCVGFIIGYGFKVLTMNRKAISFVRRLAGVK